MYFLNSLNSFTKKSTAQIKKLPLICIYFVNGNCKNGDECMYTHDKKYIKNQ